MTNKQEHVLRAVLWDLDGTLIDSEPYWHESEITLAQANGGDWNEDLAWQYSGGSLQEVARAMIERGTKLSVQQIADGMVDYVAAREKECVPWVPGVHAALDRLAQAGIPSVLVSNSPRRLVENVIANAPEGTFVGYICGDDGHKPKPSPEAYLSAGAMLKVDNMATCVAFEDSWAGLTSAADSGATTIAQTAFSNLDVSDGPQFTSIHGYEQVTAAFLEDIVRRRLAMLAK